nr:MAG: nucleoprotein [Culex pheuivirus 3]
MDTLPPPETSAATPWYAELEAMSATDLQKLMKLDTPMNKEEVKSWISMFEYQGFDPILITKIMASRAPSKAEFITDVSMMITLAMTRGTVITKIKRAIHEAGSAMVDHLVNRYGLVSTGGLGTNRKTAITLARVCACFPIKCVQVMLAGDIRHPDQIEGYHPAYCFPAAATLIPKHHPEYRELYKRWSLLFAKRTTKRGMVANNDIAVNLLEIGDDHFRNVMWNMSSFLIVGPTRDGIYSNGIRMARCRCPDLASAINFVTQTSLI